MDYLLLKTLHVLSATVLFGTGLGTAFHMWVTHRRGDVRAIAVTAANVVQADFLFTTPAGIVQPVSGFAMMWLAGFDPLAPWLVASYALYALAGLCWLPVVAIQLRVARIAQRADRDGVARGIALGFWLTGKSLRGGVAGDSTSVREPRALDGRHGRVCCLLGRSGRPAHRQRRAA